MAVTTNGFAKVHVASANGKGVDKAWLESLNDGYNTLRNSFRSKTTWSYDFRMSQLKALEKMLTTENEKMAAAVATDMNRPHFESETFEVASTVAEVRFAMRNLKSWMRAESVDTPPVLQMGSSRVERIPKGVVFVLGAWNFPFHLSLAPCIAAIAAGNCVAFPVAAARDRRTCFTRLPKTGDSPLNI
eukprot:s396_g19.t3